MAGSVNKVILIGNLGRDPEIRTFQNGGRVAQLSIATSERWTDRNSGEKRERTEWHRVAVLNDNLIQVVERFLKKGSKVYVEGQLETRKWQDQSGQDRYTTEVVLRPFRSELTMLDSRQGDGGSGYGGGGMGGGMGGDVNPYDEGPSYGSRDRAAEPAGGPQGGSQGGPPADLDDEIPF